MLLERGDYEKLFKILQSHFCLLELIFKIERNMMQGKWSLNDSLEDKKNCCFVPVSENDFVIKMHMKNYFPHGMERRIKMEVNDSISMKLSPDKSEVFFFGTYMETPLNIFFNLMNESFPNKLGFKKGILRVRYSSSIDILEIIESLISFHLSYYQIHKTYIYVYIKSLKSSSQSEPVQQVY